MYSVEVTVPTLQSYFVMGSLKDLSWDRSLYIADLIDLVEKSGLRPHLYVDDTQIYGCCSPDDTQALQNRVTVCISDVDKWMASNRLQLNAAKTEVLWCASNRQQHSSQVIHFLSVDLLSSPQSPFVIWAYFWTATFP